MTQEEFNSYCALLAHASHVVQWGGADVWKVGRPGKNTSKVFTVGGWNRDTSGFAVSFKTSEIGFEMLRDSRGCRPAPYLASRGMKWIQRLTDETVTNDDLKDYIRRSHKLVSLGLTKKLQKELGLNQEAGL